MPFALPTRTDPAPSTERLSRLQTVPTGHHDHDPPADSEDAAAQRAALDVGQWVPLLTSDGQRGDPDADRPGGGLLERLRGRLPGSLSTTRLDPGVRGALGLAALAAVAALVAVILAWRAAPRPATVALPRPVVDATGALSAGDPASAARVPRPRTSAAAQLVVDVAGRVRRPGVVRLPPGSRVGDAVQAAGGVAPGSSTLGLSLARRLVDGEQIVVGAPPAGAAAGGPGALPPATPSASGSAGSAGAGAAAAPSATSPLDLNTADIGQLDALPGVGPVLAQRIVQWRDQHGGFTSPNQLRQVSGLGGKKGEALLALVHV